MRAKIKWKEFFILLFSVISIILLFIPFPQTISQYQKYNIQKGSQWADTVQFPWRSYNQYLNLNINITSGNLTILILDDNALYNWFMQEPYETFFYEENVINLLNIEIFFDPPVQGWINILFVVEEDSTFKKEIVASYMFFYSNYGFFFLSITVILGIYYIYKKYKHRF